MKQLLKTIGLVVALAVAFTAGLTWTGVHDFATGLGGPHIKSDYLARQRIKRLLPALPETAHHLYFATKGGLDPNDFFACSVQAADFPSLLANVRKLSDRYISEHENHSCNEFLLPHGPDSWTDVPADPVWDLKKHSDLVIETKSCMTTMYSPSAHRIFVFASSH
jgi:hypothetical protein